VVGGGFVAAAGVLLIWVRSRMAGGMKERRSL